MRQTLNINKLIICSVAAAVVSATAFTACSGYTPDNNSYFYDNGDTYRIIELDESRTVNVENYPIISTQIPVVGAVNFYPYTFIAHADTLFFDAADGLTRATAECVYNYFGIEKGFSLNNEMIFLPWSGLCTFNNLRKVKESNLGGWLPYEGGDIVGSYLDEATVYTFNYTDCSKMNGEAVRSGSFRVLRVTGISILSKFDYDDFTDLYLVKGAASAQD